MHGDVAPRRRQKRLLPAVEWMKAAHSRSLSTDQLQYNSDSNNNSQREQTFKVGDYVFVDCLQPGVIALESANEMANH